MFGGDKGDGFVCDYISIPAVAADISIIAKRAAADRDRKCDHGVGGGQKAVAIEVALDHRFHNHDRFVAIRVSGSGYA